MPNVTRKNVDKAQKGKAAATIEPTQKAHAQRNNKQTIDKEADNDSEQYSDPDGAGLS